MKTIFSILNIILFCGLLVTTNAQTTVSTHTIEDALLCTSCDLKASKGAVTACSVYGCQYDLKTEKVTDANGKRTKKYEGKIYHILLNDNSKELNHKHHKKQRFTIQGKIYDEEAVIEVVTFAEIK